MFVRGKQRDDAEQLVSLMVAAFAAERIGATYEPSAGILITMPGGERIPMGLGKMLAAAGEIPKEELRDFADGVVRGFVRGFRRQGVLVGTHYPLPRDDVAGQALLDAFRAAGFQATFVDPQRISVRLADGSEAITDVSAYRANVAGASADALQAGAAAFVRLGTGPLADAGAGGPSPQDREPNLRIRLYTDGMLGEPIRSGIVARELASGLWETVAVDRPDSVQPLPRTGPDDPDAGATDELFRVAVGNTVEDEFTLTWFDIQGVRTLHIGGEHPYMAAHVHVLTRYLDSPAPDGALVSFPLPEVVMVHPVGGVDALHAVATLQEVTGRLVDGGHKAISKQVYRWLPSERARATPGRDVAVGQRPDLRPVDRFTAGR